MDPKPVVHSRQPAYPTRREVLAGAASFTLVGVTACQRPAAQTAVEKASVAPIFEHGEGRGATGCIVVTPPMFLSEEEAMQIVKEELSKHGIQLAVNAVLKDLTIAPRYVQQIWRDEASRRTVPDEKKAAALHVTGIDGKKAIAIQLICLKNYGDSGGVDSDAVVILDRDGKRVGSTMSTVHTYDFKDAARYVATEIGRKSRQRLYVGVFYDPLTRETVVSREERSKGREDPQSAQKKARDNLPATSQELLRLQAQDFVAWLKEQKAI